MQVAVNDIVCLVGEITEQQSGAWIARIELDLDEDKALSGTVTIKVGSESFKGTVVRGETPEGQGRWIGHIVGGAGGLEKELAAKNYHRTTLQSVAQDALGESKESLDTVGSDAAALGALQGHWTRTRGKCRVALSAVAQRMNGFWRVTRAGKVVFRKEETWQTVDFDYAYIDADPSDGKLEIAPEEAPTARPGITFGGHKVSSVRTVWDGAGVRQQIGIAVGDGDAPRSRGEMLAQGIRKATENAINYSQWYRAKIVSQAADGTVDLLPDDPRVRGAGISRVPILHGIPGLTVKVVPGTYVELFYQNGDPGSPACALAPDGSNVQSVQLQALQEIAIVAPAIKLGPTAQPTQSNVNGELLMAYIDGITNALTIALGLITPGPTTTGGAPAVGSFQGALAGLAAAKQAALSTTIKVQ
jgi:hypothetical protein